MASPQFLDLVSYLRIDRVGKPKPYEPLLLASVAILIHKGEIRSRQAYLDGGLRSVFYPAPRHPLPRRRRAQKRSRAASSSGGPTPT